MLLPKLLTTLPPIVPGFANGIEVACHDPSQCHTQRPVRLAARVEIGRVWLCCQGTEPHIARPSFGIRGGQPAGINAAEQIIPHDIRP